MKLSHKISLYIPSTVNGNVPASKAMIDKFLDMAKNTFANLFGGFTVTPAQGGYMSPEHGLIEEQIQIVYSFCSSEGLLHVEQIKCLARNIAKHMGQECITLEIDNAAEFITAA